MSGHQGIVVEGTGGVWLVRATNGTQVNAALAGRLKQEERTKIKLAVGDHVHFLGHTTDFEEDVGSMEVEHHKVEHAKPGDDIGVQVLTRVRPHDKVFKVVSEGTAH